MPEREVLQPQFGRSFNEGEQHAPEQKQLLTGQPKKQITLDQPQSLQTDQNILEAQSRSATFCITASMGLQVTVDYAGGVQFGVSARQHKLLCDQPTENGGSDEGMTPPELLLASLGTCAAYYAAEYLRTRRLESAGLRVHVTAEKLLKPARLDHFQISIEVPSCDDERHREGVLRAAKNCLIHNTLLHTPAVGITVNGQASVAPAPMVSSA